MKKLLLLILIINLSIFAKDIEQDNHWLKTYKNYKNYNFVITNIAKLEEKIKNPKLDSSKKEELIKRLSLNRSKLYLYENNNSFDMHLLKYKKELKNITLLEFLFKSQLVEMEKTINRFKKEKELFYKAKAVLQNEYNLLNKDIANTSKLNSLQNDINYFVEYSENIEKTEQNLVELKLELEKKYIEYKEETFIKHLNTLLIVFIIYIFYKIILAFFIKYMNLKNSEVNKNYSKLLFTFFVITIFLFITIRYINDLIYIITFLGVVAAALTIAMREVLLNIAGAIYIFFTSVIKVGDRVMVQFETKHTIGDIVSISLVKIKLNEVDDYTNIKELKSVGRTVYIPNSYIFTKVFYNYSLKKNGLITELLEFEFESNNDFDFIQNLIEEFFKNEASLDYKVSFSLNSAKTGVLSTISYETNYKEASKNRSFISIRLLNLFKENKNIKLKAIKTTSKIKDEDSE